MSNKKQNIFQPAFGLKNRHLQTLYASFFKKDLHLAFEIENFTLSDGDFLECYWFHKPSPTSKRPIVVLFHGLSGSYKSPYIQGLMLKLHKAGFASVLMHFRGCAQKENALARSYHSGDTKDALEYLHAIQSIYKNSQLFGVGFSLGANMLLKLLGEEKTASPLCAAIGVSPPMQLDICADKMQKGFSRLYQKHLLNALNKMLADKYDKHNIKKITGLTREQVLQITSFWEFDELYTAPAHGFSSANEYYKKSSSKQYLKDITTPTLIIHAQDDPFMTPQVIPTLDEMSPSVELELSTNGGHVGFISGSIFKPNYWLEERIVEYFLEHKLHI